MKLKAYLKESGETIPAFATRLGRPIETVKGWVYEQKSPRLLYARQIEAATGGKVTMAELLLADAA